ncbi:hypothetical protein K438DRAFT_2180061 [Mycena galopus ATCC 62051]|nr:hypothetical protein K438DRAFT_2180061 [Mycena galopus ATCC 62051]
MYDSVSVELESGLVAQHDLPKSCEAKLCSAVPRRQCGQTFFLSLRAKFLPSFRFPSSYCLPRSLHNPATIPPNGALSLAMLADLEADRALVGRIRARTLDLERLAFTELILHLLPTIVSIEVRMASQNMSSHRDLNKAQHKPSSCAAFRSQIDDQYYHLRNAVHFQLVGTATIIQFSGILHSTETNDWFDPLIGVFPSVDAEVAVVAEVFDHVKSEEFVGIAKLRA